MKKSISILLITAFVYACNKDKFPKSKELKGTWTEITESSYKHQLRFENETIYFIKSNTIDTLNYRLDKNEEKMFLKLKNNNSEIETEHRIIINKKRNELTIWNLFITTNSEIQTKFKN